MAIALLAIPGSDAVSNGHTFECNARGNFGCSSWKKGDRMQCTESKADMGIMYWVARPVHTEKYTLTAGAETHYIPGAVVRLFVTVHDYDWKYKGLFVHAVDENEDTVGSFDFPGKETQMFWEPPTCPGRLIHNSADLKKMTDSRLPPSRVAA